MSRPTHTVLVDAETTRLNAAPDVDNPHAGAIWELAVITYGHPILRDGCPAVWELGLTGWEFADADPEALAVGRFEERRTLEAGADGCLVASTVPGYRRPGPGASDTRYGPSEMARRRFAGLLVELLAGAEVWAANPYFDCKHLAAFLRANGQPAEPWWYRPRDVEEHLIGYFEGHADALGQPREVRWPKWSSDEMAQRLAVEPFPQAERHTAWGDVRHVERILRAMGVLP